MRSGGGGRSVVTKPRQVAIRWRRYSSLLPDRGEKVRMRGWAIRRQQQIAFILPHTPPPPHARGGGGKGRGGAWAIRRQQQIALPLTPTLSPQAERGGCATAIANA